MKRNFEQIIKEIAVMQGMTPAEVRKEMQYAMDEAMRNPSPQIQAAWASIPRHGKNLTLEEFVEYMANMI